MNSITERFKEYLSANGISRYKAEEDLGLGDGTLYKIFERNSGLKSQLIEKIHTCYPDFKINFDNKEPIKQSDMDTSRIIQGLEREIKNQQIMIEELIRDKRRLENSEALDQARATIKAKDDQIQLLKREIEEKAAWKGMTLKDKDSVSSEKRKHSEK